MQTVKIFQSGSRYEMSLIKVDKEYIQYYLVEHPINLSPDMRHYDNKNLKNKNKIFVLSESEYSILEGGYNAMLTYIEDPFKYSWFNTPSAMLLYCSSKGLDFERFL